MPVVHPLNDLIHVLRRRVRLLMVEHYGLMGVAAGACLSSLIVILSKWVPDLLDYRLWIGSLLLGAVLGAAFGLFRKLDDLSVAIAADRRTGSKERLSTAVSFEEPDVLPDIERAVIDDAAGHYSALQPRDVFRHRFGKPHIAFLSAALILLGIIFAPQIPAFQSKDRRQEVTVMKQQGKKLVKIAKDIKKVSKPGDKQAKVLAARLQKLGREMNTGRMTKKQAMLKTQKLNNEVKALQNKMARQNSGGKTMEKMQDLAKKLGSKSMSKSDKMKLQKQMAQLAKSLQGTDMDKLAQEMLANPQKLAQMSPEELKKLLDQVQKLQQMQKMLAKAGGT